MSSGAVSSRLAVSAPEERATPRLSFDLLPSKFRPPVARPGVVARSALVDRLATASEPIISVVAPPGYGKTTLLAQWAERRSGPVAWVSCDGADNDPVVLLSALAVALNGIQPIDQAVFAALASSGAGITFVPRFVSAIAGIDGRVRVVLDQVEVVTSTECRDVIAEFAVRLPSGWQLAVASRIDPPLPTARLRVQGGLVEVSAADLAMDSREASALLKGAGVQAGAARVEELLQLTEGWAAGLYLAALAMRAGAPESDVRSRFAGDDRFMGDYLRSELLDHLSDAEVSFMCRTAVLDRMCGPLCDAVLERTGSGQILERMERRNLLVVALDRRREWYRYHHLMRELLETELRRREPDLVADLHLRAASWHEANAAPETAIGHAQQAGDFDRAVRLVLDVMQPVWASGRVDTVLRWMQNLRDKTSAQHYVAIAVHGALIFALLGQAGEAERWASAAERAPTTGVLPDGSTVESTLAYLRAFLFRGGVEQMRRDAQLAWDGLRPDSPYRAAMLHTVGISYLLQGDVDSADPVLARALDEANLANAWPAVAMILAERCFVSAAHDDWAEVAAFAQRATEIVESGGFEDYWTSALVYAWAARSALHRREISQARLYLGRAVRLRPLLTYALPAVSVQTLLELARCYIALGDPGGAAAVLRQAHEIIQQRPDLGTLTDAAGDLQMKLARINQVSHGPSSLTAAELRVLPLLSTHLSFREIGDRLSLSFHTVKSQAYSIYQKLGVSSRSQAVARGHELGLDNQ